MIYLSRNTIVAVLLSSMAFTVAQSKYSGIYTGNIGGNKYLAAFTAGGRVLALDNGTQGLNDAVDPNRSTVSSNGAFSAAVPNGTILKGTIDSKFVIKGTAKSGGQTVRFTGKRILK